MTVGVVGISAVAAVFHLYAAGVSPFTALVQRPVHLALMMALGLLGVGLTVTGPSVRHGTVVRVLNLLLLMGALASCVYLVVAHEALVRRAGSSTVGDLVAGAIAIGAVLELARRTTGWGLVAVAILALGYAVTGPYLPGPLAHRGYGPTRLIEHLYLSTEGIWGVPLGVSADFVYLFVLFGAVLEAAGGGQLLIAVAARVAGRTRGGPAKTASIASAIMGSLSGSAVANVVTTGSLTIPLMKRVGFRPHFAGAVEAAASTGGQLMPPIMGAGAFILATWTNIPYVQVALAATIPAILYYVALLSAIHFRAVLRDLPPTSSAAGERIASRAHLFLPLFVIVALLAMGRSPMRAAFWGVVAAAISTLVGGATRLDRSRVAEVLVAAARGTVQVAAACAAAGIVVGVASLTGIGLRLSDLIVTMSGGNLGVALVLTAVGSIVLGMGLPTTAAYVVLAALGAPALTELGVPVLAAHLFIFYFGCISNVTPPVSLAAYAGAGIAGAPATKTALTAMALAGAGFIVPFVFVFDGGLLLVGSVPTVIVSAITSAAGLVTLAAAAIGAWTQPLTFGRRVALASVATALLLPTWWSDVAGALALAVILGVWRIRGPQTLRTPGPSRAQDRVS
jgi:TRAP transporter 4TM/12TM fusion protein